MINNRSFLSTSSLINKPFNSQEDRQDMPSNSDHVSAGDDLAKQKEEMTSDLNAKTQEGNSMLNDPNQTNPGGKYDEQRSLGTQVVDEIAGRFSKNKDITEESSTPEVSDINQDSTNPNVEVNQPPKQQSSFKKKIAAYLIDRTIENKFPEAQGLGNVYVNNESAPQTPDGTVNSADSPADPRRKASNPKPTQPEMNSPKINYPQQVGPPKMRMPSIRIPKMRF